MQIDKNCPISRPLMSQWSVTFAEFIVLYTLVKEEATGTHYWLVTATFTSTCLMTKTLFIVGFLFCCPHRYVYIDLVRARTRRSESNASLASYSKFTSNVQQRMRRWKFTEISCYFCLPCPSDICGHRSCSNTDVRRKGRKTN